MPVSPASIQLSEGQHTVSMAAEFQAPNGKKYVFEKWNDGSTDPIKVINLTQDIAVVANYKGVSELANVTFSGEVSNQVALGVPIIVTVTKPDNTTEDVLTATLADKTYSVAKQYTVAGSYKAKAHKDADTQYAAADSAEVPFEVSLEPATVSLIVAVA